jgi:MFS family permease
MMSLLSTFGALQSRNYRLYLFGHVISVTGNWMQKLGQAWLVLELSGSGTLLGATLALQHLPTLLVSPWGGLLADRLNKRGILIATQALAGALAIALGLLTAAGAVELWMVMVLAFALGMIHAFDKPARNAFVMEMVGPDRLLNAVMLNGVIANAGRAVGPAISGFVIANIGLEVSFLVNGVSYLAAVLGLLLMRTSELDPAMRAGRSPRQLREGFAYLRTNPILVGPVALLTVAGLFAFEWAVTLPLLARETFGGDAQTFGLMFTAMGTGAVIGGLAIAGSVTASVGSLLSTAALFSAFVLVTSFAPSLSIMLVGLFLVGASSIAFKSVVTTLVQVRSAPEMRGRMMSFLNIAVGGTTPLGAPLAGFIAENLGPRSALSVGGLATGIASVFTVLYFRRSGLLPDTRPSRRTTA